MGHVRAARAARWQVAVRPRPRSVGQDERVREVITGSGAADRLDEVVARYRPGRILVVGSPRRVAATGVLDRLGGRPARVFDGFRANPVLPDVLAGVRMLHEVGADLVIGVGGGSAMDTAKMIRLLPPDPAAALALLHGDREPDGGHVPLIVLPTTAGTGSEVTPFATVYVDGRKHSLDLPAVRPDVALIDPGLSAGCPAELTFSCALDALAHSVESYWSVRSTPASRRLAGAAARGLVPLLAGGQEALLANRADLCALATTAGLAISETRTTVGHAFAYPLTIRYGVPHGLAAALSLSALLPVASSGRVEDPRGPGFVADRLAELAAFFRVPTAGHLGPAIRDLIAVAGFATTLSAYGVRATDLPSIAAEAQASNRSENAPVAYDESTAVQALREALDSEDLSVGNSTSLPRLAISCRPTTRLRS
ncbi:iron-containing alcohol dehydrogenase family protein [Micromonospora sp. KC207]|nr:iron-containing alcohol dehydrogenase family protein [Micromonospora sp. KC207]